MVHNCQYLCSELVTVTYEEEPGKICQTVANLEEISATGAVVLLEEQPSVGATISLSIQGRDVFGVIKGRLHDAVLGWYAMLAFDATSVWNHQWTKPKHLLAICDCSPIRGIATKVPTLERTSIAEENVPVNFVLSEA
jgi:hypothetical protein